MAGALKINLLDIVMCISDAVDLADEAVANHHKQVAYIAHSIGNQLGLSKKQQDELLLAGALHDIGALSLRDRLSTLQFEIDYPHEHAATGYRLLKTFKPFFEIATIIRMHHLPWNYGAGSEFLGVCVPIVSHILHLADRISVSIKKEQEVLSQVEHICSLIKGHSGKKFMPEAVDAFLELSCKESFWFDATSKLIGCIISRNAGLPINLIMLDDALELAELFARIIDFRSRFTATHSSGVAATAEALAKLAGYLPYECQVVKMAGYLHDLGKLAVPKEILEKPFKLTKEEFRVIQRHPYLTYRILETIDELQTVRDWGALHHERLDGNGYPFHLKGKDIPHGSRIMAVADVFTAITEDRPYRKGMDTKNALKVIQKMAANSALDGNIVSILKDHLDEVNGIRFNAQELKSKEYRGFEDTIEECA